MSCVAVALIVAQLVIRGWLAASGGFYWDDLIFIGRASSQPILSWDYLGAAHDGHFMPAAFLVAGITTVIAPVSWWLPAVTLVVLQAAASLAVWRMIRTVGAVPARSVATRGPGATAVDSAGRRPARAVAVASPARAWGALAALAFYLFTPMTVPSFAWWAAALNSLPMQAAMAWIVADAVLLGRGGRSERSQRRIVIRSAVVFLVALAFFEKSLFILPVAFAAAVLVARWSPASARLGPVTVAFLRARRLWTVLSVIFVGWVLVYLSITDAAAGNHSVTQTLRLVWRSVNAAVVPSFVGGPWQWDRWIPSPPMGFAPVWMVIAGWVIVALLVVWSVRRRVGAVAILVCTALYVVGAQIPVMWNRSSANTALELAQTMRYLPDSAVVITLAIALIAASPVRSARPQSAESGARHARDGIPYTTTPRLAAAVVAVTLVVASSLIAMASFSSAWRDDPTESYLASAKRSLAANREHTMFDQSLPLEVLLPVAYPQNQISHTFGRVADRSPFGDSTDRLMVLDNTGALVPGAVTPRRTVTAGRGSCARPEIAGPSALRLDGPLIDWLWTVQIPYCATADGVVELSLAGGRSVRVPVRSGLRVFYAQLSGHGTDVRIRPLTPGLALHTGSGRVGEVVDARHLDQG
ncbi:hypothetical protein GCM10009624_18640 [Gordonia sinesedis]